MATKKPTPAYLQQKPAFNYAALDEFLASSPQPAEAAAESRSGMRAIADTGLAFGRGAVQGVRMFSDLAGADNTVSSGLRTVEDFIGGLRSAQAKQDEQAIATILKEAEGKGVLDQVVAGARAFAQAPVATAAQALGTSVPTIAAALATGGAGPGAALMSRLVPAAVGAGQGVGAVKGSIYDEVRNRALEEGRTEEEANALAEQAQAYSGPNAGQLALGGGLGALAGSTGLERGLQTLRRGATETVPGMVRRVGMGALTEAAPEALQGGQEKYATNVAQDRAGFPTDPMAGVVASGTMEAMAGGLIGGVTGIPTPRVRPGDELRQTKLPETGPMTRALNQGVEAGAQAVDKGAPIPVDPDTAPGAAPPAAGMEFEADPRFENAPTFGNGQAPASQRFGTRRAADLFIGEQGLMGSHEPVEVAPGAFEVRPTAAPDVSMVTPGVYELPPAPATPPAARVTRPTQAEPSTGAPAQADEGTAPQAPVAPVLQPEPPPADSSLPAAGSEPPGDIQPGDITMGNGKPFTVKNNGLLRAFERRMGPEYVRTPVQGGIVLRKAATDGPLAGDAQPGAADDGAVAGNRELRGGDTGPVAAGEPAGEPVGAAIPGDAAAQLRPGEPEPAAELKPREFDPAQPVEYGRFKTRGEVEAYRAMVAPQAETDPDMAEVLARIDQAIASASPATAVESKPATDVMPAGLRVSFGGQTYEVQSVEEAQAKWTEFRDRSGAGVSEVGNGIRVTDGAGRFVARISYNGRVWGTEDDGTGRPEKPLMEAPEAAETLRTELQQVEQQILAAAPGRFAKGGGDIEAAAKRKEVPAELKAKRKALKEKVRAADAAPKPKPAPAPAPAPEPPPALVAAAPEPAPEPPKRTPEQARTIELKKRLKVLEALRRCVG